jgi:soluble P-type ATPase
MAKEAFVTKQKQSANETLMIGDGLNDAGALRAGDVGRIWWLRPLASLRRPVMPLSGPIH